MCYENISYFLDLKTGMKLTVLCVVFCSDIFRFLASVQPLAMHWAMVTIQSTWEGAIQSIKLPFRTSIICFFLQSFLIIENIENLDIVVDKILLNLYKVIIK